MPQPKAIVVKSEDKYAFDRKVSGIKVIKPLEQSSEEGNPEDQSKPSTKLVSDDPRFAYEKPISGIKAIVPIDHETSRSRLTESSKSKLEIFNHQDIIVAQ